MARKPLIGTVATNVIIHGTGALNIDGSRVVMSEHDLNSYPKFTTRIGGSNNNWKNARDEYGKPVYDVVVDKPLGRWPANFIHDGSDEGTELLGDSARFFYCAKASKKDRNEGLDGFDERQSVGGGGGIGDYLDDVNSASGKFGSEKAPNKNNHPTVKPTELMRYLVRMVTPPNGTVLDPFMGSGSTGKAAVLENFSFIGIDQSADYLEIATARINHAQEQIESRLL
jgi:site-specific DNA-methyltransferase (adenine-specific)